MNLGPVTAGYKEKAKQKITEARIGRTADFLVSHLIDAPKTDTDILLTIKRQPHHGWPGRLLSAVGLEVEQRLLENNIDGYVFDIDRSKAESQSLERIGYGNPPRLIWSPNHITFAFRALNAADITHLDEYRLTMPGMGILQEAA